MAHKDRQKIRRYLENNNLLKKYAKFLDKELFRLNAFLNGDAKLHNKDLAAFYAFTGVHPKTIGINRDMDFFSSNGFNNFDFLSFSDWVNNHKKAEDFIHEYFQSIINKVEETQEKIFIFDYMIDNTEIFPGAPKKQFFKGYQSYYNAIENQVQRKGVAYERVLGLPNHSNSLDSKLDLDDSDDEQIKSIKKAIALTFNKTFEHLCKLFKSNHINLYILPTSPRNHSIMIIDQNYILTEYFRVRRNGKSVPDLLFINHVDVNQSNHAERLRSVYSHEFKRLIDDKEAIKVDAELFCACTRELHEALEFKLDMLNRGRKNAKVHSQISILKERRERLAKKVALLPDI